MITSAYISLLRRTYNDNPKLHKDVRTGNGIDTVYKSKFAPILESSVSISVSATAKSENTDFTLNYDTGDLRMTSAPTNNKPLNFIYKEVNFRDAGWLDAIAMGYRALGDQIYGAVIMDTSSVRLSAGLRTIPMPANCIRLLSVFESTDGTVDGIYRPIRTNWKYNRQANELIMGAAKTISTYAAISYLTKITPPSAVTMAMPGQDTWFPLVEKKAGAYYLRSMANRIAQQGNATVEEGHFNPAVLRALANDEDQQFEILRKRLKPVMPSITVQYWDPKAGELPG